MSTADFTPIDPSEPLSSIYRSVNSRTEALRSIESAAAFPATTVAGQFVFRTDVGWAFQRNQADTAWIAMWRVDNGPWSPHRVGLNTLTATNPWVTTTEVAIDPGGGIEVEGLDLVLLAELFDPGVDLTIKVPDDIDWAFRKILVSHVLGHNGSRVFVVNESDDSAIITLDYPGDFALLQVNASGTVEIVQRKTSGLVTKTSTFTIGEAATAVEKTVYVLDATSGNMVVNLPDLSASTALFQVPLYFKRIDASGNTCTLTANAGDNIDAANTKTLAQWDAVTLFPDIDTTNWYIV